MASSSIPGHLQRQGLENVLQAVINDDFLCSLAGWLASPRDKDGAASLLAPCDIRQHNENF